MKKIVVKIIGNDHSVYKEIINYPPSNVFYKDGYKTTVIHYKRLHSPHRKVASLLLNFINIPRVSFVFGNFDLIHSGRGILILSKLPYVVDFEHVAACVNHRLDWIKNRFYRKILEKLFSATNCRKILPWSYAAEKTIRTNLNTSRFEEKIEVVYPAMHPVKLPKSKERKSVNVLFVGHAFEAKGGRELLLAFCKLSKRYDVSLNMVSNVPKEYLKLIEKHKNIHIVKPPVERSILFENLFSHSDIFVLPTYIDSFGFSILEAMSFGMPVITTDFFAGPEIIEDNKSGFLIRLPNLIKSIPYSPIKPREYNKIISKPLSTVTIQLVEKLSVLIENDSLRKKMGRRNRKQIEKGKFSIRERNRKLRKIYETAIQ
jgi:glycosyltransferase involved in cell wall biosynthesis